MFGPCEMRFPWDQATMGEHVGTLALKDGKGVVTNLRFRDGACRAKSGGKDVRFFGSPYSKCC
jgi:hypothetical protein